MSDADAPADLFEDPPEADRRPVGPQVGERVDVNPPATLRELLATAAAVGLFDLLVYRAGGYAAAGLFLVGMAPIFAAGSPFPRGNWRGFAVVSGLLALTAVRLAWLGWWAAAAAGVLLLVALGLARTGRRVWVTDLLVQFVQTIPAAPAALLALRGLLRRSEGGAEPATTGTAGGGADEPAGAAGGRGALSVLLPAAAGLTFALLFLLANPDLRTSVGDWLGSISARFGEAIRWLVPGPGQVILWGVVAMFTLGTLRPLVRASPLDPLEDREADARVRRRTTRPAESHAYPAVRNTLVAVVIVFAVYLPYEFLTLWRRDFPEGFYYAGYAHEGAAWLTAALAAATALLSAMMRGSLLTDPRVGRVRTLAWVWSGLNFLLVAAALNRLLIYVDFNGLSRMRVVGLLGIAAVGLGFAAVVVKIARDRGFSWLVRRHARIAALVTLTGVLLPTDLLVHRYNAGRIAAGDPAPLAIVGNHAIDAGGLPALEPLLDHENPVVARGTAARLLLGLEELDRPTFRRGRSPGPATEAPESGDGWLARLGRYQYAERRFRRTVERNRARIDTLLEGVEPVEAADALAALGMRWW